MLDNKRKAYVYRFVDDNNNTLYVGKTVNLYNRMKKHWSNTSHLTQNGKGDLYDKVQRIEYISCKSEVEALHKELDYINYYKPRYNTEGKTKEFVNPPEDINKWKVYKVLRDASKRTAKLQHVREKWISVVMFLFYISILVFLVIRN